jgi:hypothetical protein
VKDDVNSLASQVSGLVEPVFGTARLGHAYDRFDDRALWGSATRWKVEACGLAQNCVVEKERPDRSSNRELAPPRGAYHLEPRRGGLADVASKGALIETVEAEPSQEPARR